MFKPETAVRKLPELLYGLKEDADMQNEVMVCSSMAA
jgi:hypothetical protein